MCQCFCVCAMSSSMFRLVVFGDSPSHLASRAQRPFYTLHRATLSYSMCSRVVPLSAFCFLTCKRQRFPSQARDCSRAAQLHSRAFRSRKAQGNHTIVGSGCSTLSAADEPCIAKEMCVRRGAEEHPGGRRRGQVHATSGGRGEGNCKNDNTNIILRHREVNL